MCRYEQLSLPPRTTAVPRAREWIHDRLDAWELPGASEDLLLLASELVSNSVLHARTQLSVVLSIAEGVVEISVTDGHPQPPRPREPGADETGGRGLLLVQALSDEWGIEQRRDGKTVWCRLTAPTGWRYAQRCVCIHQPGDPSAHHGGSGRRVVIMDPEELPGDD